MTEPQHQQGSSRPPVPYAQPQPPVAWGQRPQAPVQHVVVHAPAVQAKDTTIAYVLWFFLGSLGVHKFYLRKPAQGAIYLALGLVGWFTVWVLVGFVFLIPLWILLLVDLFTIPAQVREANGTAFQPAVAPSPGYGQLPPR
jgi:TM2 domain-containing membrane protein YozV